MEVAMLGWGFPPDVTGGLDTHVGELFEGLRAEGVEVRLVLPSEHAPEREGIVPVETGRGDILTRVNRMTDAFVDAAAGADVIHTHDWFGYGPGSQAAAAHDVPWLTSFHSLSSDRNVDPPEREVETERRLARRADHSIAVSKLLAGRVSEQYGADPDVVYNGFSTPTRTGVDVRDRHGVGDDDPMLLFVGRHTHQKGIDHLFYALEHLQQEDLTLVVGGTGHLTPRLERFAELLGVRDKLVFAGYVSDEELGDYYAAADLFVSPSLSEPFGITITEALMVGTRVVATESGVGEILSPDAVVEVDVDSRSLAAGVTEGLTIPGDPEFEPRPWSAVAAETLEIYEKTAS
jgi:glycosyltransferase involved in cell wall biosynthesis